MSPSNPGGPRTDTSQSAATSKAYLSFWVGRTQFLQLPDCPCALPVLFLGFCVTWFIMFNM